MNPRFQLVEKSVVRICKFPTKGALLLADHYYLSEECDFARSIGWGLDGLEVRGRVRVTSKEVDRIERFIQAASYSIATHNCEHFAKYVKHGLPMSAQVDPWWLRLGADAVSRLLPSQNRRANVRDYIGRQVTEIFKNNLKQARITRASQDRIEFWRSRGIDVT